MLLLLIQVQVVGPLCLCAISSKHFLVAASGGQTVPALFTLAM